MVSCKEVVQKRDGDTLEKNWTSSTAWKFYFQNISIPRKTFPYYGNWIFQPFSAISAKCFHTVEEVQLETERGSGGEDKRG